MSGTDQPGSQGGAMDLAALRRVIANHLGLGSASDAVTADACRALLTQAQSGEQRLRLVLATVFFLAETEHAPQVDLALVQRATALHPNVVAPVDQPPRPTSTFGIKLVPLAMAAVVGVLIGSYFALHMAAQTDRARKADFPAAATTIKAPVTSAALLKSVQPTPGPVAPPAKATIATESRHAAAAAHLVLRQVASKAPSAPHWQPVSPPPTLRLRFSMASSLSPPHARFIQQRLMQAGFIVDSTPEFGRRHGREAALRFYYEQDRGIAYRVAGQADLPVSRCRLMPPSRNRRVPPPGTIELYLP